MILGYLKINVESTNVNSKLRQQFTSRVLGRSPRRMGCGENAQRVEPRGKAFPLIIINSINHFIDSPKSSE